MPHRRTNNSDGSKSSQGSIEVPVILAPPPPPSPLTAPIMFMGSMPESLSKPVKHSRDASPASVRPSIHSSRSTSAVPKLAVDPTVPAAPSKHSAQSTHPSKSSMTWKNRLWLLDNSSKAISESPTSSTATLTPSTTSFVRPVMERGVARKEEGPGHIMFLSEVRKSKSKDGEKTLMAGLGIDDGATVANIKENLVSELMPAQADKIGIKPRTCFKTAVGNMLESLVQWDHDRALAMHTWPGNPPALSSLPTEQKITPEDAAEVVERFRTAMCMLPSGEWRCRWANLEEHILLALLKMTFRLARPVLAWEMDTDLV